MGKKDGYQSLRYLQESLEKLFGACGYEGERVAVENPGALRLLLEELVGGGLLCTYVDAINDQVKAAASLLEDQRLDRWNQERSADDWKGQYERQRREAEAERGACAGLRAQLEEKRSALEASERARAESERTLTELVGNLISMRDALLLRRSLLEQNGTGGEADAYKAVVLSLRETADLLTGAGVEILSDTGPFDSTRHTVVDTVPTDDPALGGRIAQVFRPGYCWRGRQLRGQEVILYREGAR